MSAAWAVQDREAFGAGRDCCVRVPADDVSAYLACGWLLVPEEPFPSDGLQTLRPPLDLVGGER